MKLPYTLWRYLGMRYVIQIAIVSGALLGLIYLFESLELIRRGGGHDVEMTSLLGMALLKLPETAQILFPFIFLIAGLSLFWQLGRASELVVMRAVGISAWQFVAPFAITAFLLGIVNVALLQPLGAASLKRYAALDAEYFGAPKRIAALNEQGLWLRDAVDNNIKLLHARYIEHNGEDLKEIMILNLNDRGQLLSRYDASEGAFSEKGWRLSQGAETRADGTIIPFRNRFIPMGLNREEMFSGFTEAATFSSWVLPEHIRNMAMSGFSTRSLMLYYQNLLATPFLWVAMSLIAAVVSLTPHRFGKAALMIGIGIGTGFFYFLFARYFEALSLTQRIPEFMAAWVPVILAIILPVTSLLKREDG